MHPGPADLAPPFTPSREALEHGWRLAALADRVERACKWEHPDKALQLLAVAGHDYSRAMRLATPEQRAIYVTGVVATLRRVARELLYGPRSPGIV